ncbi:hypothetical protein BV22DRAFT_1052054 [Leucogyrophana mollusca]|uniref:Uncharacterized protein n=1 Tax=Leucogyrophana mollusca TaxID=85980 RepID=A0ACB8AXE9_9AGAM|nr:hypothetical protein BV22DRAFT_1052054 [Leucogyrophana mollusca]
MVAVPSQSPSVTQKTPGRAAAVTWTIAEETTLISYLVDHKSEVGNGNVFKEPTYKRAADHINQMHPVVPPKIAKNFKSVRTKYTALRKLYYTVRELKGWSGTASGMAWSDENGGGCARDDPQFLGYCQSHKDAKSFYNKGFPHYNALDEILAGGNAKGDYQHRPSQSRKAAALDMDQLAIATDKIKVGSTSSLPPAVSPLAPLVWSTTPAPGDPSTIAPSAPSSFVNTNDDGESSSVVTSVSRGKRKFGAMEATSAPSSTVSSGKRSRPLSAAVQAQQEGAQALDRIASCVEKITQSTLVPDAPIIATSAPEPPAATIVPVATAIPIVPVAAAAASADPLQQAVSKISVMDFTLSEKADMAEHFINNPRAAIAFLQMDSLMAGSWIQKKLSQMSQGDIDIR